MTDHAAQVESLLIYPTEFPLKVMGKTQAGFAQTMLAIVKRHAPDLCCRCYCCIY